MLVFLGDRRCRDPGTAIAIAFGVDRNLQTFAPGYTQAVQDRVEQSTPASTELRKLTGAHELTATTTPPAANTYLARKVYIVLGGTGTMTASVDGRRSSSIHVDGDRLYTAVDGARSGQHLLELRFSPGVLAYSFTFG
jgi:hypothetical protein